MNFPHTAIIRAMSTSGSGYAYSDVGTTDCFLQPLDIERAQLFGLTFGKAFNCYLPIGTSISEKNRLVIDGETYGVKGVSERNYGGLAHKQATLERTT